MVAQERIKRAETEEELREARMEKEALKSALKVIENENGRLRRGSLIYPDVRKEIEGRRGIDLGEVGQGEGGRNAIDEPRQLDGDEEETTSTNAEAGPSKSRSSSRIGMKSPVHSRRSSDSELKVEDILTPIHEPSETESVSTMSSPAESQSHTRPTHVPPLSVSRKQNSSSLSLDDDEYATPMSGSQSQSLAYPFSQSDVGTDSSSASHTHPTSIPKHEPHQDDTHEGDHHQQHTNNEEDQSRNTNNLIGMPVPSDAPTISSSSSSTYFSPPNPTFQPSSPGNYLVDEPSPWA